MALNFNWAPNNINQPWTSVSINSTGQNVVASMEVSSSSSFLYYYNQEDGWNVSTIQGVNPNDGSYQVSICDTKSFVAATTTSLNSYFCYYYSEDGGNNYDFSSFSNYGGEVPQSCSINSNGNWLSAPTSNGYPFTGNATTQSQPLQLINTFEECPSYSAVSDTNYGFICCQGAYSPPVQDVSYSIFYSNDITNFNTWNNNNSIVNPCGTSQQFFGISCSGTGKYIIVATELGIYVSSNGNDSPPTFTQIQSISGVTGVSVSKSGKYGLFCQNTGTDNNIFYSSDYLQNWTNCTDSSLSTIPWSSVSISDEYNYNVYAVASANVGYIYSATINVGYPPPPRS
jgi:hypothetical protein